MFDYQRFICNMYDPRLPDSDDKLVSASVAPEKKAALLRFMRDMLDQYDIGEPCETILTDLETLKANNIVGIYRSERTTDMGSISLFGNFTAEPTTVLPTAEETKKKFQMNFRKRPKQMYKFPVNMNQIDKTEVLTIDDYVPPKPIRDDD